MFFAFLLSLAMSDEEIAGTHSNSGDFLPLVPTTSVDGRGLLPDYPDLRIPIKRLFRFVSSFQTLDDSTYGLQKAFGQITNVRDSTDFVWNFTSYGIGGRLSNEDQPSFVHLGELDQSLEPNTYGLTIWAKVTGEQGQNFSVLLFNDTVTFYEVVDLKDQVASVVLYVFFVGVVAGILYVIFSKDKVKVEPSSRKKELDYSEIHAQPAGGARNPSPRAGSPKRNRSPK